MILLGHKYITPTGRELRAFHFVIRGDSSALFVQLLEDVPGACLPVSHVRLVSEVEALIAAGTMAWAGR